MSYGIDGMTTGSMRNLLDGPGSDAFPGYSAGLTAGWASLPHNVLVLIVDFVKKIQDLAAFGSVCKSWHGAATKDRFKALWLRERTPYLMLPVRGRNIRDLYSLAEGEIVSSIRVRKTKRKCYESLGWFLAVRDDGKVCLLDPFSSTDIPLPHLNTLAGFSGNRAHGFVKKMVLSSRPSDPSDPSNFVVGLIFRAALGVAFWKPGDKSWHLTRYKRVYEDITYHDGKFYVFDEMCNVTRFNILNGFPKEGQVIAPKRDDDDDLPISGGDNVYIVKIPGSLLLVTRLVFGKNEGVKYAERTHRFDVYKFYTSSNTWKRIKNLGKWALFVGSDIATTVVDTTRFPGFVKANHIYFTDDGERNPFQECGKPNKAVTGKDMGIYNLGLRDVETDEFDPFYPVDRFYQGIAFNTTLSHPTWIFPFMLDT